MSAAPAPAPDPIPIRDLGERWIAGVQARIDQHFARLGMSPPRLEWRETYDACERYWRVDRVDAHGARSAYGAVCTWTGRLHTLSRCHVGRVVGSLRDPDGGLGCSPPHGLGR